jgi:hypothetical protein
MIGALAAAPVAAIPAAAEVPAFGSAAIGETLRANQALLRELMAYLERDITEREQRIASLRAKLAAA